MNQILSTLFVIVNKIVHIRMGATERVHLGVREITKKLRMLAAVRWKYFFSLSPSENVKVKKEKTIDENDQIWTSTSF